MLVIFALFLSMGARAFVIPNSTSVDEEKKTLEDIIRANPGTHVFYKGSQFEDVNRTKIHDQTIECRHESACPPKETCNLYLGHCQRCSIHMEICRRDENCCDGKSCLWGRCQVWKLDGEEKSLCRDNSDCLPSFCCARHEGVSLCKRYLAEGDKCTLPEGGLRFSLTHECPCQRELSCKNNGLTSNERVCTR